jgi:Skp family chaperone for outer membrane proteins
MKKSFLAIVVVILVAWGANVRAQMPTSRIVTIDLNRLFNEYYKTPIASDKLKDTATGYNKDYEEMVATLRKQTEDLNKLREEADKTEYSADVREQKKKAVQEKLAETNKTSSDIEAFKRSHQEMLAQQTQRMREGILKEIRDIVNKESRDAGYQFVLDKSGNTLNGVPTIVFSQDALEITEDILKILNKNAPKTSETPKTETPKFETPKIESPKREEKKK